MSDTPAPEANDDIPEDFHPYVRLLIIRMRSHPEDFNPLLAEPDARKKDFMTGKESEFVWREERKLVMNASHETLMRQIMKANEPEEDIIAAQKLNALQQMNAMQSNSALYNQNYPNTYNAMQAQIPMGYTVNSTTTPTSLATGTITSNGSEVLTEANMLEKMKQVLGI